MTTAAMVLAGIALFVAACGVPSLALGLMGGSSVGRSSTARAGSGERGQAATATPPPTVVSEQRHYVHSALIMRGVHLLGLALALGVVTLVIALVTR